jgi:hypothetical protein
VKGSEKIVRKEVRRERKCKVREHSVCKEVKEVRRG